MLKIKSDNPNYLAQVIEMPKLKPHPNADRWALAVLRGQTIITGKDAKVGSLYILFQLESQINNEFLSYINGYSDPEYNRDKTKKGFFSHRSSRVKATRLRGVLSEGYLHPVEEVNEWLKFIGIQYQITKDDLGKEFDHIGNVLFVEKYINKEALRKLANANKQKGGKVKRESRIVDNQFRLSPDYKHLKREIHTISPDDWIELTSKWHGCNAVISKVLTKRKLSIFEKIAKKIGVKVQETEYSLLYSSRRVIKSEEFLSGPAMSFYDHNVWELMGKEYSDAIQNSLTLYGEIVGFTPTGSAIQSMKGKPYDYGCKPGKCEFYCFRITSTSPDGNVYEFSLPQVIDYCLKHGIKHVPVYYIGRAKDKYPELDVNEHWHQNFLNKLIEEYLEKDDIYCNSVGLADEGIVLSRRVGGFEGLKLKSQRFILGESEEADSDQVNIEDQESIAQTES